MTGFNYVKAAATRFTAKQLVAFQERDHTEAPIATFC